MSYDDQALVSLVSGSVSVDWSHICPHFPGKTQAQVIGRWTKAPDPGLLKGSWTHQEDKTVIRFVGESGTKSWTMLATLLPGRIGKQCRERWVNHLNPAVNHGPWTPREDQMLIDMHARFGNHWTRICALMPSRSDNSLKNRWNSTMAKRMVARPAWSSHRSPHSRARSRCSRRLPRRSPGRARGRMGRE